MFKHCLSLLTFLLLVDCHQLFSQKNQPPGNNQAIKIYEEILATRNPNAVIGILDKVDIDEIAEDSLRSYLYYYKGSAYGQIASFDSAIYYIDEAEKALNKNRYPIIEIQILRAYGNINWIRNYYHLALKNYEDALNISYDIDNEEFQISLLGNIAGVYAKLDNLKLALDYAMQADKISQKSGVIRPRSHMKIGNYLNDLSEYEKAIISLNKTRDLILKEGRDSIALGVNYINIAASYFGLGKNQLTKDYLDSAQLILNKIGVDFPLLSKMRVQLALRTNNMSLARRQLKLAEEIVLKQKDKVELKNIKELAKELALKENRLKDAIHFQDEVYALNDSIKTDKMVNRVYELQTQYETARKEAEIENLKLANELKDQKLISSRNKQYAIGIGAVMFIIILVLFFSFKYKKEKAEREAQELQIEALKKRFMELHASPAELAVSLEFSELNSKLNTELTEREFDALKLSLEGKTNTEIADSLFISVSTVKFHLRNTYSKMGVGNRKEAFQLMLKA